MPRRQKVEALEGIEVESLSAGAATAAITHGGELTTRASHTHKNRHDS